MHQTFVRPLAVTLALCVLLLSQTALALPNGWWAEDTGKEVTVYDQHGEPKYHAWQDPDGTFHEESYRLSGSGSTGDGVFTFDTRLSRQALSVAVTVPVARIQVYEAFTRKLVYQSPGYLFPGMAPLLIPTAQFSNRVQFLLALDANGNALDYLFFKSANACSGNTWISL